MNEPLLGLVKKQKWFCVAIEMGIQKTLET